MIRSKSVLHLLLAATAVIAIAACNGGSPSLGIAGPCSAQTPCSSTTDIASIRLGDFPGSLSAGDTATLAATALDSDGNPVSGVSIEFESSAPDVASVDNGGLVTARTAGTTTITASASGKSASVVLQVTE
jgi:alpha-amylase